MNAKMVFLDIDGTIYDNVGRIPNSTIDAIHMAQANGHCIMLCSGRSEGEIPQSLWDVGFDGMIGSAGASIRFQNELLFHQPMQPDDVTHLWNLFYKTGIPSIIETNECILGPEEGIAYVRHMISERKAVNKQLPNDFLGEYKVIENPFAYVEGVNKFLFFDAPFSFTEIEKMLQGRYTIVPNSVASYGKSSGEISELGMTKAAGIQRFLTLTGKHLEDTIAIGDGINDMQMLSYVNLGIAMGNAVDELKKNADYITTSVTEDGIYNAFLKFHLL